MIYELSTGASENMNGRKLYGQRPLASLHVGLILDGQGLLTYWNLECHNNVSDRHDYNTCIQYEAVQLDTVTQSTWLARARLSSTCPFRGSSLPIHV